MPNEPIARSMGTQYPVQKMAAMQMRNGCGHPGAILVLRACFQLALPLLNIAASPQGVRRNDGLFWNAGLLDQLWAARGLTAVQHVACSSAKSRC